jgi:hypothetical protein
MKMQTIILTADQKEQSGRLPSGAPKGMSCTVRPRTIKDLSNIVRQEVALATLAVTNTTKSIPNSDATRFNRLAEFYESSFWQTGPALR